MFKFLRGIKTSIISSRKKKKLLALATVGSNVKTGKAFSVKNKSLNRQSIKIGNHCVVDGIISVGEKGVLEIGDYSSFKESDWISVREKVFIGSHVFASELVFISDNDNHPISPRKRWEMTEAPLNTPLWKIDRSDVVSSPVIIEDCVWLGRGCMILKGVTIGRGSIVAAGAIVTKSVPPFSVVAGNPAKVVKSLINDLD